MEPRSLYDRLGGKGAINAVIDDFVARAAADGRINAKFARTDVPRLKAMLVEQVSMATGGPVTYTGRGMRETHDGMGVTAGEFDALVGDLVATLNRSPCRRRSSRSCWASSGRSAATSSRSSPRRPGPRCLTRIRRPSRSRRSDSRHGRRRPAT